ncbi:MAG: NfeD family protein [Acidimicrobiia bacterium]
MDSPDTWRWVWLIGAAFFIVAEMFVPASLFFLPFAIGAAVAALLAFAGVNVAVEWLAFVAVSAGTFAAFVPWRRKLDRDLPHDGIGSRRLIGEIATVLDDVPAGHNMSGLVRVGREEWRAESVDGAAISAGRSVKVVEVRGTRVLVHPLEQPSG